MLRCELPAPSVLLFAHLPALQVSENRLAVLPEDIGALQNLTHLNVRLRQPLCSSVRQRHCYCFLTRSHRSSATPSLPLSRMASLPCTSLSNFGFGSSGVVLSLTHSPALQLRDNRLAVLPDDIGALQNLKSLIVCLRQPLNSSLLCSCFWD